MLLVWCIPNPGGRELFIVRSDVLPVSRIISVPSLDTYQTFIFCLILNWLIWYLCCKTFLFYLDCEIIIQALAIRVFPVLEMEFKDSNPCHALCLLTLLNERKESERDHLPKTELSTSRGDTLKDPFFGPMFVMKLRSAEPSFPDQSLTESLIVYIAPSTWNIHTIKY